MENEQEGINLEAVNLGEEGIVLPGATEEVVEETVVEENNTNAAETNTDTTVDEEKEALKRDINKERKARKHLEETCVLVGSLNNNDLKAIEKIKSNQKQKEQRELN